MLSITLMNCGNGSDEIVNSDVLKPQTLNLKF